MKQTKNLEPETTATAEIVDITIIGAGLTGLCMAHWARRKGLSVRILERSERVGGQIRTYRKDGFIYESGPNTGIISNWQTAELFASLGEESLLQTARQSAKRRLILKHGKFLPLPSGSKSAITTPLFSWRDKLNILMEPFRTKGTDANESIASLVKRRLGQSYLTYAVDPFVGGIYAGDPTKLVTRFALPKLYALEQEHGSFIRGAIAKMRTPKSEDDCRATKEVFSALGGLSSLVDALTQSVGTKQISLSATIREISPRDCTGLWHIQYAADGASCRELRSRYVISTVGTYALRELFPFLSPQSLRPLEAMRYAPIVQVSVGYKSFQTIDFEAFGGLIPSVEDREVLGILHPSACFSGRAPEGGALLSIFLGGMRSPHLIDRSDAEIELLIEERLEQILGVKAKPDLLQIFRHSKAIPQYEASTEERLSMIGSIEAQYPGLILAGNMRGGIGMADRIAQAYKVIDEEVN
ncbi:MAG: protoporphyrinogen oxidase [Porphyromonadaceae bacterium]|nr:protoporphyrinogen oxidase [Porphyromonadaceae bacterium]